MDDTTATMRNLLELAGVTSVEQLYHDGGKNDAHRPLHRVNALLAEALHEVQHGEQVMRRELEALKQAADRDLALLEQGYTTTEWTTHHAARVEAGRQKLLTGARVVTRLAPLRRALLDGCSEPAPLAPAT